MDLTQIKRKKRYYGFTLVELIIVITILAILATISFVSFSGYTKKGNDTKKLTNLQTIEKGLDLLSIQTGKYPNPDKQYGTGTLDGVNLNYVGYVGEDISKIIKLDKVPIDNVTNTNYVYGVSSDFKKFQIATTFEDYEANILIPKVYAGNLKAKVTGNYKYPLKIGDKLYSLPSLIFVGNVITNTGFIVDGGENSLFDKVNNKQTTTKILEKITGSGGLILTGVTIPQITNKEFRELKNSPNDFAKLGIKDKDYLGEIIYGDKYLAEQTTKGGKTLPEVHNSPCPKGYILVPGDKTNKFKYSDGSSTNDFCVMKYEAKEVGSTIESKSDGTPINKYDNQDLAISACNALNTDGTNKYHLITNNEWMTIARNIEQLNINWSSLTVGSGYIYSGHNDNLPNTYLSASNDDNDGFNQTQNSLDNGKNQKRTLTLSNGETIWDFSGNLWEHVNVTNNVSSLDGLDLIGRICNPISTSTYSWYLNDGRAQCGYNNKEPIFFSKENYGPFGNYNINNGIGRIFSGAYANKKFLLRGGGHINNDNSGIYGLTNQLTTSFGFDTTGSIGFRCSYSL